MFQLYGKSLDLSRTAVHYLICITLGIMLAIPGPTLLDLQQSIGEESSTRMGFVFTSRSIGYLIGSLMGGILLDYFRYGDVALILSSVFLAVGAFLVPWCKSFAPLLATFSVIGFSMGFSNTGSNACCLSIWGKKGAPVLQGLHFCFGFGGLIAPLLATVFLPSNQAVSENSTLLGTLQTLTTGEMVSVQNFSDAREIAPELQKTLPSIIYIYSTIGIFTMCVTTAFVIVTLLSSTKKPKVSRIRKDDVRNPSFIFTVTVVCIAALQVGLISSVEISFSQLLTSYVYKGAHKLSMATGYMMTSTYWGTFTLARALTIAIAMKVSSISLIVFDFIVLTSGIIILRTMGAWSVDALWVGTCVVGFGVASFFPGTLSWVEKYININNKVVSAFTVVTSIFEMTVPMTVNLYLESKPSILFEYMLGATVVSCILFASLHMILGKTGEKYELNIQPPDEDSVEATSC